MKQPGHNRNDVRSPLFPYDITGKGNPRCGLFAVRNVHSTAGCFSRELQEIEIPREFSNAKIGISGLAMSEKFTGSSELQISAGYLESVRDLRESLQTFRCLMSCL